MAVRGETPSVTPEISIIVIQVGGPQYIIVRSKLT